MAVIIERPESGGGSGGGNSVLAFIVGGLLIGIAVVGFFMWDNYKSSYRRRTCARALRHHHSAQKPRAQRWQLRRQWKLADSTEPDPGRAPGCARRRPRYGGVRRPSGPHTEKRGERKS